MATFNLVRNSRVFFSTDVNASTGKLPTSGASMTTANTKEITVLDGFSFSQNTQQNTIQLSEAGNNPVRGQRAFNTSLDPVEFSFSTYLRPYGTTTIDAEEAVLWNALLSADVMDTTGTTTTIALAASTAITRASTATATATIALSAATNFSTIHPAGAIAVGDVVTIGALPSSVTQYQQWAGPVRIDSLSPSATNATSMGVTYLVAPSAAAGTTATTSPASMKLYKGAYTQHATSTTNPAHALIHSGVSNKNQLQKFGMYFLVDNALYAIDNCVMDSVSIDFGLDGIATLQWSGKGTELRYLPSATVSSASAAVFGGTGIGTGTAAAKLAAASANYITNKLSTMSVVSNIQGTAGTTYTLALTGGNLNISNNVTYVTPANIGVVNKPVQYFTGTRSISGSLSAYLRTGTNNSVDLLNAVIAQGAETKFSLGVQIGGASNAIRADVSMPGCVLQVPTVETGDVMSTTINFTAQGFDPSYNVNLYDIEQTNDLTIRLYSNN